MVNITINGREIKAEKNATILEVARDNGIESRPFATMNPSGRREGAACAWWKSSRGSGPAWSPPASFPVEEGLQVQTETEKVKLVRKTVLELLWAKAPGSEEIQELAAKMGIEKPRFKLDNAQQECILCGLCVKTCEEAVGVSAIGLSNRGTEKKGRDALHGAHHGLHRLRGLPFYLPDQRHPDDRKRRRAQHLGAGFQTPGLPGLRQLICSRIPAGVDGEDNRRFPRFPQDLPELPKIESHIGNLA